MNRIRTRLIVASLCVALLPALPLSLVVRNLLERSFNPATSGALAVSIEAGLEESRDRLQQQKAQFAMQVEANWRLRARQAEFGASGTDRIVVAPRGEPERLLAPPAGDPAWQRRRRELARYRVQILPRSRAAAPGEVLSGPERVDDCLAVVLAAPAGRTVTIVQPLPEGMLLRAQQMTAGLGLLRVLQNDRGRVLRSYVVPFLLVYTVLILLAIAIGALLSLCRFS